MRQITTAFIVVAVAFFALSCQSGSSPTTPDPSIQPDFQTTGRTATAGVTARQLWGYYQCLADLDSGVIEVVPSRTGELHLNVNKILNQTFGIDFQIDPSSTPSTGYFAINVSITHPYPGNVSLTGFDVRGILLTYGDLDASGYKIPGDNNAQLLNADGWTRWWNATEFTDPGFFGYERGRYAVHDGSGPPTATVNPYKMFGDALWDTADADYYKTLGLNDQNGRAIFRSGRTNVRRYEIQFPVNGGPRIAFDYAIDASWAAPDPNPPQQFPMDFPIWANCLEPFLVEPIITDCTLAGIPFGGDGYGEIVLSVELWDWQGWLNTTYDGQIGDVRLYSPYVEFDTPLVERADGIHNTTLTITASGIPSTMGIVPVLIEIPSPGTAWSQTGKAAPSGEIAAYAMVMCEVIEMECRGDDNVTCDDAVSVELTSTSWGSVCMPHDPTDYSVFIIPSGAVMRGTIELDNYDYADNDLILYKGCPGDPIDQAINPSTQTETINIYNLESGMYYIAVFPGETAGSEVQPYKLVLDIQPDDTECTTDNNNEYTQATFVGLQATYEDSVCAGGDIRDWLKVIVPTDKAAGGTVFLDNMSGGNIDIRIYDEYPGPASFWGSNPGTEDEMVNVGGLGPGNHYIEIVAIGGDPEGDREFSLDLQLTSSDYNCTSGDGNDSHLTADPIGFSDIVTDSTCFPADPDWLMFIVDDSTSVSGTITLSGEMISDNDLYVYDDPEEAPIAYSANAGIDDEIVELENLDSGTYYIKVSAHPTIGGGDQDYTLTTDLEEEALGDFDFKIHAHIVCMSDGSNPATTQSRVQNDVAWANEFYSRWGGSFTLDSVTYINKTSWLAATSNEMYSCHLQYRDRTGPINVYYVNSFPDMTGAAAYCRMDCRYAYQTHNSTYVAMSDYGVNRVLAHELGHATGIFHDVYLLDMGFSSCWQINQYYCPYSSGNGSYCDEDDADYGNLMYFGIQNWNDPEDYWLSSYHWQEPEKPIESQIENWRYFHINYENNF